MRRQVFGLAGEAAENGEFKSRKTSQSHSSYRPLQEICVNSDIDSEGTTAGLRRTPPLSVRRKHCPLKKLELRVSASATADVG
jgi:hypothetical protein